MKSLAYIGTQGEAPGEGIHAVQLNEETGTLVDLGVMAEEERPTWTLPDPTRAILYAVSEVGNRDERFGAITSFKIEDGGGTLRPLSRRRTGGGATHLVLNDAADMLYCANFGGPNAVAVPVANDGLLEPISAVMTTAGIGPHRRQTKPHPHGVTLDPSGRFLLVPDMGADKIFVYRTDGTALIPAETPFASFPAGCGPRFVLFGSNAQFAYLVAELTAEVFQLGWDSETGTLKHIDTTRLDRDGSDHPPGAAAFGISADGRFLYVSNRGTHEMQVYSIDPESGNLAEIQRIGAGGEKPWGLGISPSGHWMLVTNQATNSVVSFAINPETGLLSSPSHSVKIKCPTSAAFVPQNVTGQLA